MSTTKQTAKTAKPDVRPPASRSPVQSLPTKLKTKVRNAGTNEIKPAMSGAQTKYCAGTTMGLISRMGVLSIAVLLNQMGLTTAFTCRAGCNDAVSRKTRMPARSSATLCSAGLPIAFGLHFHPTTGQREVQTVHVGESSLGILGQAAEHNSLQVGRDVGAARQQ